MAALPGHIAHAKKNAPGFARILKDVKPQSITSRKALATLPVTRKSDLGALQKEMPPLGGLNATPVEKLAKLFLSPGPIYDPEGRGANWWRSARGLFAGGFRPGDRIINTFAYHFTPAGSMLESGALALGCTVIPAGTGQTEIQVAAIRGLGVVGYVGTPSFLRLIVEKADELKVDIACLKRAQVGAEYLPPVLRTSMRERGITVTQMYGSADLGVIAYESLGPDSAPTEGMILEEALILEIVRPGTGDPVAPGEVGEVVITSFNKDYPLIRFGTGDLSAILPGKSPCGRTNVRLRGWMELTRPGSGSNQVMPLFSKMPVVFATTPEPNNSPRVDVNDTMFRWASTTLMWVVHPSPPAPPPVRAPASAAERLKGHGSPAVASGDARSSAIVAASWAA